MRRARIGNDPFAVLLADDFIVHEGAGITSDLVSAYEASRKTQLSVMEVNMRISQNMYNSSNGERGSVAGLVEKPVKTKPSTLLPSEDMC